MDNDNRKMVNTLINITRVIRKMEVEFRAKMSFNSYIVVILLLTIYLKEQPNRSS